MPARRSRSRRNWPTGLYSNVVDGVTFYRYRDPVTRRFAGLGSDFEVARQAAAARNAQIAKAPVAKYIEKLSGGVPTKSFSEACNAFMADVRERRGGRGGAVRERSQATLDDYERYCTRFRKAFGDDTALGSISLAQISDYLDGYGDKKRARNMARGLLAQIWAAAIARGWHTENLPERTIKVSHGVARQRLTIEQFESIVLAAEPWFASACWFALFCDQRREDVSSMPTSAWSAGALSFEQEKTGHAVVVTAGELLSAAVRDCLAGPPEKSTTIIRKPGRKAPVSDDMLTRAFQEIRDQLIAAKHPNWRGYKPDTKGKPTWHEVRSLGAHLAKEAGRDAKNLGGHATDQVARMYQQGHAKVFEAESL